MTGIPTIWHFREFLEEDQENKIWCRKAGYKFIGESQRIITVSDAVKKKYEHMFGDKLSRVYDGIDLERFRLSSPRRIFVGDVPTFIFVGRLNKKKGCHFLIRALEEYSRMGGDFRLMLVGDRSPEIMSIVGESSIASKVEFLGYQKDTQYLYRRADVAFTCSDCEAFGRITVEAMMSGCLEIGVDAGCTSELILDGVTGLKYTKGDIESLVDRIRYAVGHKDEMREIAENGRLYATKEFTAERNATDIERIYGDVLADKKESSDSNKKTRLFVLKLFSPIVGFFSFISESTLKLVSR